MYIYIARSFLYIKGPQETFVYYNILLHFKHFFLVLTPSASSTTRLIQIRSPWYYSRRAATPLLHTHSYIYYFTRHFFFLFLYPSSFFLSSYWPSPCSLGAAVYTRAGVDTENIFDSDHACAGCGGSSSAVYIAHDPIAIWRGRGHTAARDNNPRVWGSSATALYAPRFLRQQRRLAASGLRTEIPFSSFLFHFYIMSLYTPLLFHRVARLRKSGPHPAHATRGII